MSEFIEMLESNSFVGVLIILYAVFVGSKWLYDSCSWVKELLEGWRAKRNGEEKDKKTVEERLEILEQHDNKQHDDIKELKEIVCQLREESIQNNLDSKRTTILDFADLALDKSKHPSREKYEDIFRKYEKYEKLLAENGMSNGQAEITMKLIKRSYEERLANHTFMEDINQ